MAPSPRLATQARRTVLSARLLDLAEAEIAGSGLAALKARSLALAAGCSVGAIYAVYPDLDELILAVNQRTLDEIDDALRRAGGEGPAAVRLVGLAAAYLDYAAANRLRWNALFLHRMAPGHVAPGWYVTRRQAAFLPLAAVLAEIRPELGEAGRAELGRSLFAAVHGIVMIGLDELLVPTPLPALRAQLATMVGAMAAGLAEPVR